MREGLALIAVAQIGMGIELQHHQTRIARSKWADGACGQGMLTAQHEREFAGFEHAADQGRQLVQRHRQWAGDGGLRVGGNAIVEVGLAAQFLVVQLELLAGGDDRLWPRRRARAVADGGLQPERDHHRTRVGGSCRIRAYGIEEAVLGAQERRRCRRDCRPAAHAWTCCAAPSSAAPSYIVSIGSSSRIASA
jgi:hypothetical protein